MPIHGLEWLFITIIIIVLVLWDPQKIPKLARALAEAKKEYEKAASVVQEAVEEVQTEIEEQDPDKRIIETARELGIETYGKTKDEILSAILRKRTEGQAPIEQPKRPPDEKRPPQESGDQNSLNNE